MGSKSHHYIESRQHRRHSVQEFQFSGPMTTRDSVRTVAEPGSALGVIVRQLSLSFSRVGRWAVIVPLAICALLTTSGGIAASQPIEGGALEAENRELAVVELRQAQAKLEWARATASDAKRDLDNFVARHFEEQRSRVQTPLPEPTPSTTPPAPSAPANDAVRQQIENDRKELIVRREQLLGRLTPLHPEVLDLNERIASLDQRLGQLDALKPPLRRYLPPRARQVDHRVQRWRQRNRTIARPPNNMNSCTNAGRRPSGTCKWQLPTRPPRPIALLVSIGRKRSRRSPARPESSKPSDRRAKVRSHWRWRHC